MSLPSVAVLLPTFNEEAFVDECLGSLASQDYAGPFEVIVADGQSTDATREHVNRWSTRARIRLVDNPQRVQSEGLWVAALSTDADVLIRADAHTTYASDYVRRSVEVLEETGATAAGGPMVPQGSSAFGKAVARVMRTPLGVGPGAFHHDRPRRAVDTVYLGAFRRQTFLDLGGMRTLPSRVAEDADFYWRLRRAGGTVILDPTIRSTYRPRETWRALFRQFARYGRGKADMLFVNGVWPSWRPLAPLALVLGVLFGLLLGFGGVWWPLAALLVTWLAILVIAARGRPMDILAAGTMHLSYGLGLLGGMFRSPTRVRTQVVSRSAP